MLKQPPMNPISIIAAATHQHDASDDRTPGKEPRFARQAVVAANKLNLNRCPLRVDSVIIGSQFGGIDEYDFNVCRPAGKIDPLSVPSAMPNLAAFLVARHFPSVNEVGCPSLACASGMEAIIQACEKPAEAIVIAGGSDWPSPYMASSFASLGVASRSNVCLPLRVDRDGTVASGGAALVALTRTHRRCPSMGRIVGVGRAFDCESRTKNNPGTIVTAMMRATMLLPDSPRVDLVVAHATGTKQGDAIEAEAIEWYCDDTETPDLKVISYRGKAGHWFGAAGPQSLIELIVDRRFNTGEHVFDDQQIEVFGKPRLVQHATQRDRLCIVNALGMGGIATSIAVQF